MAAVPADEAEQRLSNLSRAYRVNLTVLALVALFVGAFLVYSVVSLSLAQRLPAFALLGVLGLTARERRALLLAECAALGAVGSVVGLALGALLAALALRWLGGDLGGGYFPGVAPALRWDTPAAFGFALLGTASALVGGWMPARRAEALSPAMALKGLGDAAAHAVPAWPGLALLALGVALAFLPPLGGLPLAAYLSVAALLFGGVALVPVVVQALLALLPATRRPLVLLALQRARFQRHTASAAVAGVVASLALSVALTVMVTSFRGGVDRLAGQGAARRPLRAQRRQQRHQRAGLAGPGLRRRGGRAAGRGARAGLARALAATGAGAPAGGADRTAAGAAGRTAAADRRAAGTDAGRDRRLCQRGRGLAVRAAAGLDAAPAAAHRRRRQRTAGARARRVARLRTPVRRHRDRPGALPRAQRRYPHQRPGAVVRTRRRCGQVQQRLREIGSQTGLLEFAATPELRALSLAIFDRSFAVTYYLQAVAIAIGLVGVAASMSAQVLARRKEFGLLSHLGLTRLQVIGVVAGEVAAWLAAGTLIGLLLGLAVSVVLVHVVNPQSFHWTMQLLLPWGKLLALCAAVLLAGIGTAAYSARAAASRSALLSVKEDW